MMENRVNDSTVVKSEELYFQMTLRRIQNILLKDVVIEELPLIEEVSYNTVQELVDYIKGTWKPYLKAQKEVLATLCKNFSDFTNFSDFHKEAYYFSIGEPMTDELFVKLELDAVKVMHEQLSLCSFRLVTAGFMHFFAQIGLRVPAAYGSNYKTTKEALLRVAKKLATTKEQIKELDKLDKPKSWTSERTNVLIEKWGHALIGGMCVASSIVCISSGASVMAPYISGFVSTGGTVAVSLALSYFGVEEGIRFKALQNLDSELYGIFSDVQSCCESIETLIPRYENEHVEKTRLTRLAWLREFS